MCVSVCFIHTYRIGVMQLQKVAKETQPDSTSQIISSPSDLPDLKQKMRHHDLLNEYQKNIANNNNNNSNSDNKNSSNLLMANRKSNKDEINKQLEQQEKLRLATIQQQQRQSDTIVDDHLDNQFHQNHRPRYHNHLHDNKSRNRSKTVSETTTATTTIGRTVISPMTLTANCSPDVDDNSCEFLKSAMDSIGNRKKSRTQKTTANALDNADIANGNICISLPRTVVKRSLSRFRTRTTACASNIEQCTTNMLSSQPSGSSKLNVLTNIKPLIKRGKRTLSSAQLEREKSDEKNTKLLRKHVASRSLSPLLAGATAAEARKQKSKLAIHESNAARRAQRKSLSIESQTTQSDPAAKANKTGNNQIIQPHSYVALRLRKR